MKTLFLLVLLSRNGAGDINASFVNTQNFAQCQQKALLVKGIFLSAQIPVVESRCISSELQFSEFGHATSSGMPRHFYLIRFNSEAVTIRPIADWQSCIAMQQRDTGPGRLYCSSSIQSLGSL
ncbi:hypothetical protein [endosymbiont of Ridgeia piscesae]|jgi:hypothetical protein|uniref:Uncharacterized protein n=1 Tax=endosymbiont of Ridgeia piscesae TaxID=54398 RepID=A0A0T5Z2Q4_9GAMM|nr:hypothetical protein [endosymbiont of Ridgeia piscesae]KRT54355.1 hypothetical protein Ga0074115_104116 [endosymbiont of Ridgeia piscesae]KRT56838.1 hypothetical protein Ga0076813_103310 [endosymbiont of Ridgeia piscesae]